MRTLTLILLAIPTAIAAQEDADEGYKVKQYAGPAYREWAFGGATQKPPQMRLIDPLPVFVQVDKAVDFHVEGVLPGWRLAAKPEHAEGIVSLVLEPLAPGDWPVGFTTKYRLTKDGEWLTADFPPITVRVTAKSKDDEPRDITGAAPKQPLQSADWRFALVGLALVAGLAWAAYRWVMTPHATRSPEDLALRSLSRLHALKLTEKNKAERHFAILSRIARRYIDRKYSMSSRRQTTAEFLATARANPELGPHVEFLTHFLEACDLAKFAPPEAAPKASKQLETDLQSWLLTREA